MFVLLLNLLLLSTLISQQAGEVYSIDLQSIEVRLVPEKPKIMLGEPIYISFIVENDSDQDFQVLVGGDYRNALGRPETFTVTVEREDGRQVQQPEAGPAFGGLSGPQKLAARGSYTFTLFLPHWATFEEVGRYTIVAKRTLNLSKFTPAGYDFKAKTTDVQAEASTMIEVVSRDNDRMGVLIDDLGTAMLSGRRSDKSEAAASSLSYIQDERVIPYFVQALETNDYNLKFRALGVLSGFKNEAAFQALQKGMDTKGANTANTTTREVANQLAANIRLGAAQALAKSPHPGAIPYLISKRHDPYEAVRITVLHVLGKMKPEEAVPILQEMTHDQNKLVSEEAKRYLNLLSPKE